MKPPKTLARYKQFMSMFCPACDDAHTVSVGPNGWTWNGNIEKPTFAPSIKVTDHESKICHSFVRNGQWIYLQDCDHEMAGETVDLPELKGGFKRWD